MSVPKQVFLLFSVAVKRLLLLIPVYFFISASCSGVYAQGITATATSDTTTILIGQQFNLKLQLAHPKSQTVNWIDIPDTLGKLEIVFKSAVDTLPTNSNLLNRQQILTFTCFDSGYYVIPPFRFAYQVAGDTTSFVTETRPLLITVNTIPVDTTKAIKDIKGPVEVPWTLADFLPYIGGAILLALLIWGILYLLKKRKKKVVAVQPIEKRRPAHEIALEDLKKLEEEKLWQQGNFKMYHTRLTDILRTYIENRWQIQALEQTTDEILAGFTKGMLTADLYEKMKFTLQTADLVKFAKMNPVAFENEQVLTHVYEIVRLTAATPMSAEEVKEAGA